MARRLGPYVPLSATYASDDAIIEAGEAAELLYIRGLAFLATSDSDGYISDAQLVRYVGVGLRNVVKRAQRLQEVGLWDGKDGGYLVRNWTKWNLPVEEREGIRRRDRERKTPRLERETAPVPPGIPPESRRTPPGIRRDSLRARARAALDCTVLQSTLPKSNPPLGFTTADAATEPPPGEARFVDTTWLWKMP